MLSIPLSADGQKHLIIDITTALQWLDEWPVGLKLNTPLSHFFKTSLNILVLNWSGMPTNAWCALHF